MILYFYIVNLAYQINNLKSGVNGSHLEDEHWEIYPENKSFFTLIVIKIKIEFFTN